jgi:Ferritin-like domain
MDLEGRFERRSLLGRRALLAATTGAAAVGALGAAGLPRGAAAQAAVTDADILNFALNLEYLEAEFYLRAALGRGLAAGDVGGSGTPGHVMGGRKVPFRTRAIREYALEIADDEEKHVQFLRDALGGAAVARPAIDLDRAFTAAARAAGLVGPAQRFDAFANERNFLLAAFLFEDVGVTAYKGAAPLISDRGVLEAAAGLLAVEAYHAGEIRTVLGALGLAREARALSDARDALDGAGADKDQGIRRSGKANIVPTDDNGLAFSRSTGEVLSIVYLGGAGSGGFFPNGVNGLIA